MLDRCGVTVRSVYLSPSAHTFACTGETPNPVRGVPHCLLDFECRGQQTCLCRTATLWGRLKRSARAVQLFGRLAVLETHTLRY